MLSDGAATDLVIEWTGGPADATGWQYRMRLWGSWFWGGQGEDTTGWTDIPNSDAATCSYRIAGLRSRQSYEVQVMATLPAGAHGMEASAELIGSGGGVAPPFPILSSGVFCARSVLVPSTSGGGSSGTANARNAPESDTSGATAEPGSGAATPTPVQHVNAALATLTECVRDVASPAEKNTCVQAYADTVDAIAAGFERE